MKRPQIIFVVRPKYMLPSTDYDQIIAYVRDDFGCFDGFVTSKGDEILLAVSIRKDEDRDRLCAYVYTDLKLTGRDKQDILDQIDWEAVNEAYMAECKRRAHLLSLSRIAEVRLDIYRGRAVIHVIDDQGNEYRMGNKALAEVLVGRMIETRTGRQCRYVTEVV